jgi:S1-C subfamily serine protease
LQTEDLPPPQLAQKQDAAKPDEAWTPAAGDDAAAHPAWRTFGLALQSVDRQAIRELKLSANAAFMVVGVDDESAGAKAGVEVGDVVVSVNGASVENAAALQPLLDGAKAGTEFKLEIFRSGKKISTQIVASGTP